MTASRSLTSSVSVAMTGWSALTAAKAAASTSQTTTFAPALAAATATARPMPLAPPVTTTTSPSASKRTIMARSAVRQHGDGVHLDQVFRRGELADLDHRGGRCDTGEILAANLMNDVEMLHVANVDINAADVIERAARLFHRRLHVVAHLARLDFDIAQAGDRAVRHARGH